MDLVIVESGAKAKTIQKYLGKNVIVRASNGHVQDLPNSGKEGSKAVWPNKKSQLPEPSWSWTPRSENHIKRILSDSRRKKVERVLIATDPDREGEFIAWRLAELFSEFREIKRITFNEITKDAIRQALNSAGVVDSKMVDAAKVRRFMDRIIGYRASRFSRSWNLSSMGRVQTPALGFVVKKEHEIANFISTPYWALQATAQGIDFRAKFHEKNDVDAWRDSKGKFDSHRTNVSDLASQGFSSLSKNGSIKVSKVSVKSYKRSPKAPFTTDTLLQTAGSRYGWKPSNTMRLAQGLYEAGHITYMRTDSTRTSSSSRQVAKEKITEIWGADQIGKGVVYAKKSSDQDAHEAIRPTNPSVELPSGIDSSQAKLYRLIWARFIGSQMINSEWSSMKIEALTEGFPKPFDGDTKWRTSPGWESAFEKIEKKPLTSPPKPEIKENSILSLDDKENNPNLIEDETKPPARYTQHGLVALMKSEGIGRPSTYAATIKKLLDRKYCSDDRGRLKATSNGITLWDEVSPFYKQDDKNLFSTDFTSEMESDLDKIETGSRDAAEVWETFLNYFRELHDNALKKKKEFPTKRQIQFYERLASLVSSERLEEMLQGNDPLKYNSEMMGELIDSLMKETEGMSLPPTAKQVSFIKSLAENLEMNESQACELVSISSFEELSGGKSGSASTLIGKLKDLSDSKPRPTSVKQMNFVKNLANKAELDEESACKLVEVSAFSELSGGRSGTASKLISILQKKVPKKAPKKK
ncbi:MAG: type IA DNA topoisomerase [Candidatus Poseidoniales archaeon]